MYAFREKSTEELIEMAVAPVERSRWLQKPPAPQLLASERPGPILALEKQSKRQRKKARKERHASTICFKFALGRCDRKDNCKFSHDLDAFMEKRRPDLPGHCPFSMQHACPFGMLCRWASTHAEQDNLQGAAPRLRKELPAQATAAEHQAGPEDKQGQEIVAESSSPCAIIEGPAAAEADAAAAAAPPARVSDGSLPCATLTLPTLPPEQPTLNSISKDVQTRLQKRTYDFSASHRLVEALGGKVVRREAKLDPKANGTAASTSAQEVDVLAIHNSSTTAAPVAEGTDGQADQIPKRQRLHPDPEICQSGLSAPAQLNQKGQPSSLEGNTLEDDHITANSGEARENETVPLFDVQQSCKHWPALHVETPLKPREKRKLELKGKLYLAPLTTVGNLPFRRVCKGLGADITCGEMALATCLLQGQASEWALLKRHPCEDFFGVQVCGAYPDSMVRCGQLLEESINVDFVDINIGCPIDLICSKGAGSALLRKPQRMEHIVRGMATVLSCPLTIKVRRGYSDGQDVAHQLLPKALTWGAAAATLHGRSREQRYTKLADWEYIAECTKAAAPLPLIGNGDIFSFTDYEEHMSACPELATTMLARGALIKPWLFTEIKERRHWDISASERMELLKQFCSAGLLHWGSDEKGVETTRRFLLEWLSFLCRYIPVGLLEVVPQKMTWRPPFYYGRSDLESLLASQNPADWVGISEMLLGPVPQGFSFTPKHKSSSYAASEKSMSMEDQDNG